MCSVQTLGAKLHFGSGTILAKLRLLQEASPHGVWSASGTLVGPHTDGHRGLRPLPLPWPDACRFRETRAEPNLPVLPTVGVCVCERECVFHEGLACGSLSSPAAAVT